LEETLDTLARNNFKIIIIIDELDKINEDDLVQVITSLKTMLNQSSALFVLAINDRYYRRMMERGKLRLKEYTLFSQKIFLQRPLFSEMEEFIDKS
jgi:Cdc6-like AAA superfamily ATPase